MTTAQTVPVVVGGGNVEGNIGSCEVKTSDISVSSFYTRSLAVNSCTGQVVSDNTYFDWSYIYYPGIVVLLFVLFIGVVMASD